MTRPELSVALVGICSRKDVKRCLESLMAQQNVPPLEIVVAYDPRLADVASLAEEFPDVRWFVDPNETSPLQLAGRAIRETTGEYVLLTEDHCIADPGWAHAMWVALQKPCGAVGGTIEIRDEAGPTDWAFYFVDFFRYARPVKIATSPTLTVCNAAYRRDDLEKLPVEWKSMFLETVVHDALKGIGGPLHLEDDARVTMRRHVTLPHAIRERYVFGRLFGASRLEFAGLRQKWTYRFGSPLLPAVLLKRMTTKAFESPELREKFLRSIGPLALMVFAWSFGEWLGYWTGTRPDDLSVAPEREGA
ncbi:MAG: glycosyltransferase [Deltaproteobacteria bacterium]